MTQGVCIGDGETVSVYTEYRTGVFESDRKPKKSRVDSSDGTTATGDGHCIRVESVENWARDTGSVSRPILCVGAVITGSPKKDESNVMERDGVSLSKKKLHKCKKKMLRIDKKRAIVYI